MAGVTKMDTSGLVTFACVGAQPLPSLSYLDHFSS